MRTIPVGEGWWGAGEKPLLEDQKIYPFTVETSDEEIEVAWLTSTFRKRVILSFLTILHYYPSQNPNKMWR